MGVLENMRPLPLAEAPVESDSAASPRPVADFPLALASIALSPTSSIPLYEQICRGVRTAISAGDLLPGASMPTIIELARALGVARNTVGGAYTRLSAEGYLVSYKRRGTRIANQLPRLADSGEARQAAGKPQKPSIEIGYFARKMLDTPLMQAGTGRPFALHSPDPALFPRSQFSRLVTEEFRRPPSEAQLASGGGCLRFQTAITGYLRQAAGVHCEPEQVIAVTTPESALSLTARVLIDPGHTVLVEDPASDMVRSAFLAAGARLETMPADSKGADPRRTSGPPPRLIWVSPSVNFPLGQQMPESRRLAVLDAARHSGAAIFESNTYGELVFTGHRLRAIQGHDSEGRVIYSGSFHRTLGPGIRVSYLVVPPALVDAFTEMRRRLACAPDVFMQSALATFVKENRYALHLKKIRAVYAERLRQTIAACKKHIPHAVVGEPAGGFHLVLHLNDVADEQRICLAAARDGLYVQALSQFYQGPRHAAGLVIGFGAMPEQTIEPSVARLAGIINEHARAA